MTVATTRGRMAVAKVVLRLCQRQGRSVCSQRRLFSVTAQRLAAFDKHAEDVTNPLTGVEVSTKEFKFVEKLLPSFTVPEPPQHASYPTPSGWVPPKEIGATHPYFVERTRFHNLPVYKVQPGGGKRRITHIARVRGDLWKFETDLRDFLSQKTTEKIYTQVDELREVVCVRGVYIDEVVEFLLQKGF